MTIAHTEKGKQMIVPKSRLSELQDENRLLKMQVKILENQVEKLQEMISKEDDKEIETE